ELETGELESSEILHLVTSDGQNITVGFFEHLKNLSKLDADLDKLDAEMNSTELRMEDVVLKDDDNGRVIKGKKTLLGDLSADNLTINNLSYNYSKNVHGQGIPLGKILADVVRYNDSRQINGLKTFTKPLHVNNLIVDNLDNVPVNDIVNTEENEALIDGATFVNLEVKTLLLPEGSTIAGLNISLLPTFNETLSLGHCEFLANLTANEISTASDDGLGFTLKRLNNSSLKSSGGQIRGSLEFTNTITVNKTDSKFLMGIDTAKFMAETVFTDAPAEIHGMLTVPKVYVEEDMLVLGSMNGRKFPDAFAVLNNSTVYFGSKRIKHLEVENVVLGPKGRVDGLSIEDIVTLDTEQYISGEKIFMGGISILGNLDIESKIIDGVNLDEWNATIHDPEFKKSKKFDVLFEGDLSVPNIEFNGTINGMNFTALAEDLVYDDESPIIITSTKTFASGLTVSNATLETFNGKSIKDFVTVSKEQTISAEKTFEVTLRFSNVTVEGLVDGVDLVKASKNALYTDIPGQIITGRKTFVDVDAKEFELIGEIKGLDIHKVVTRDGEQKFTAPQKINIGNFASLACDLLEVTEPVLINGLNFSEAFEKRVSLSSPFNFSSVLGVNGQVIVNGSLMVDYVNDQKLSSLLENIVYTNQPSVIKSKVVFTNVTALGPISSKDFRGANGISIREIADNAVYLDSDNIFLNNVSWEEVILEGGVVGTGLFNGYDIRDLYEEALFTDVSNQTVTGSKSFVNCIYVKGNLDAQTINGIDLRESLFTRNTEQNITGTYQFSDVTFEQNVNIIGNYNNINMKFANSDVFGESETIFKGDVIFHGNISAGQLHADGYIEEINAGALLSDAVKLDNTSKIQITGNKSFTQIPQIPNANLEYLNGINFTDFVDHVLTLSSPKNLTGTLTINGTLTVPEVLASKLEAKGSVDGVNLTEQIPNVLFLNKDNDVNVSLEITGDVYISTSMNISSLNERDINTEFLTMDTEQVIPHDVTFQNITTSDVSVDGTVNSWNLTQSVENSVKNSSRQVVHGTKNFTNTVRVLGNVEVLGRVGSDRKVKLASQAVQLNAELVEIGGTLVFKEAVRVEHLSGTTDIINGINYTELCDHAWILDQPSRITGKMIFEGDVILSHGLFYNTSDGQPSIGEALQESFALSEDISKEKVSFNKEYSDVCDSAVSLNRKLENAIYEGDYFELINASQITGHLYSSFSFQVDGTTYLAVSWGGGHCFSTLYKFNPETYQFIKLKDFQDSGHGEQWLLIENNGSTYLGLARSKNVNPCSRAKSKIWKLIKSEFSFHQELEPADKMSVTYSAGGVVKIYLHAVDHTTVYKLNPRTEMFEIYKRTAEIIYISLTLLLQDMTNILFLAQKGFGKVMIKGKTGSEEELGGNIASAVLFEQHRKVFIAVSCVSFASRIPRYEIRLFAVNLVTKSFRWLDQKTLASPANLTSFYAGNPVTGTTYIIAAQNNRFPLVYTLLGEKLRLFAKLDIPRVDWVQYIGVPRQRYQAFPDHFLLLCQKDNTYLAQLIMKGASVPLGNLDDAECNIQYISNDEFHSIG
ncbi:hypothetical protein SK128_014835, partial [Halocaridina rubra]